MCTHAHPPPTHTYALSIKSMLQIQWHPTKISRGFMLKSLPHEHCSTICHNVTTYAPVAKGRPAIQQQSLLQWKLYSYSPHHKKCMTLSGQRMLRSARCGVNCCLNWNRTLCWTWHTGSGSCSRLSSYTAGLGHGHLNRKQKVWNKEIWAADGSVTPCSLAYRYTPPAQETKQRACHHVPFHTWP